MDSRAGHVNQPTGGAVDATTASWGPAGWIAPATSCAAVAALAWLLLDHTPENQLVAGVLVVVFALVSVVVVRIRVRLRATADGIVITGPLRSRQIPWDRIDQVSSPHRGRFGRRGASLEIEVRPERPAGTDHSGGPGRYDDVPGGRLDDELLAFGAFDLGTDPAAVGRTLLRLRRRFGP